MVYKNTRFLSLVNIGGGRSIVYKRIDFVSEIYERLSFRLVRYYNENKS